MKDKGLDKGLIREFNASDRDKRGWDKGFFGFRKMFWDYLNKLNVPFYDACCAAASDNTSPVRFNVTSGSFERFNGTAWVGADDVMATRTGLTALAAGGQTGATALTAGYNEVNTVATAGDSTKLPDSPAGTVVTVKNDGANSMDVFPFLADTIDDGAANVAYKVPAGETVQFTKIDGVNWEADNQVIVTGDGTVAQPALSFTTQPNMGFYKVSSTQMGASVSGTLVGGWNATGLYTGAITEQVSGAGIQLSKPIIRQPGTAKAVNITGAITAAELAGGLVTSTSAAAVTATLPTASLLATQLGAVQGTIFEFIVDNHSGANAVTVAVNTGITVGTTALTGGDSLAVSVAQAVAVFRLIFTSTTTAILRRIV